MITTIQVHDTTKKALDKNKQSPKESYEEVIIKMMLKLRNIHRADKALLEEAYKERAKVHDQVHKEWESTSPDWE
ncbi:MAG: hypothetical protein QF486_06330 [Candidatus Woesearchaeota archaeon]|jgi:hypothetical protein|nr:hypothetical protein [Candidatus Woesearchaeota archaeon]MDP7181888.1 hypothetical protein [Candidatus Woesearchaeota archaeon]MDP7199203.1 hypothetical protein [Candidatus Woesearchaeota archaeon]MDP7467816.1 hypothetical protein [Candidatus Woesearchaeota archaeon]MDP7647806.1 hypothetical protein [Candidatus Woesearchaeota archaeon]|tara:strand:+ start:245 stop:469 length:225 start_codon:yes stop_codon:yes gene_type:complete